jgi:hypothetical protein
VYFFLGVAAATGIFLWMLRQVIRDVIGRRLL